MKKLTLPGMALLFIILIGCQSNADKEPSVEPYPTYDTNKTKGAENRPNPDSIKSIGSPEDDQHH